MESERPFCVCLAGPNGSGKSTLASRLKGLTTAWLDPDEIAASVPLRGLMTFEKASQLAFAKARNARANLAKEGKSFGFETVFSHPSNADFLKALTMIGYRVHLYYVCTSDPSINVQRVANRVKLGGHSVPTKKIEERWHRSQQVLRGCVRDIERIVFFDNSRRDHEGSVVAEIENTASHTETRFRVDKGWTLPSWFHDGVLREFGPNATGYRNETPICDKWENADLSIRTNVLQFLWDFRFPDR